MKISPSNGDLSQPSADTSATHANQDGFFFDLFSSLYSKILMPLQDKASLINTADAALEEDQSANEQALTDASGAPFLFAPINLEAPQQNLAAQAANANDAAEQNQRRALSLDSQIALADEAESENNLLLASIADQDLPPLEKDLSSQSKEKSDTLADAKTIANASINQLLTPDKTVMAINDARSESDKSLFDKAAFSLNLNEKVDAQPDQYVNALNNMTQVLAQPIAQLNKEPVISASAQPLLSSHVNDNLLFESPYRIDTVTTSADPEKAGVYNANIKLYPPELGEVLAKLHIDNQSAQLTIMTENERVKEVMQQHLPELREHFQQANIHLTHLEIKADLNQQQNQAYKQAEQFAQAKPYQENNASNQNATEEKRISHRINALVDTYA